MHYSSFTKLIQTQRTMWYWGGGGGGGGGGEYNAKSELQMIYNSQASTKKWRQQLKNKHDATKQNGTNNHPRRNWNLWSAFLPKWKLQADSTFDLIQMFCL